MAEPPRWAPDLPLPAHAYVPGAGQPRPTLPLAQALAADGVTLTGIVASAFSPTLFGYGIDCFHAGCFWEAHECWEVLWRREPRGHPRRALLQGLILLAAARVKHGQGRPQGAEVLQRRALVQLERAHAGDAQLGVDVAGVLANARAAGVTGAITLARAAGP